MKFKNILALGLVSIGTSAFATQYPVTDALLDNLTKTLAASSSTKARFIFSNGYDSTLSNVTIVHGQNCQFAAQMFTDHDEIAMYVEVDTDQVLNADGSVSPTHKSMAIVPWNDLSSYKADANSLSFTSRESVYSVAVQKDARGGIKTVSISNVSCSIE